MFQGQAPSIYGTGGAFTQGVGHLVGEPLHGPASLAHLNAGRDQRADHVMGKCIGYNPKDGKPGLHEVRKVSDRTPPWISPEQIYGGNLVPVCCQDLADGRAPGVWSGEGPEVMQADALRCSLVHGLQIQAPLQVQHIAPHAWIPRLTPLADTVQVGALQGREAGIEAGRGQSETEQDDVSRQQVPETAFQGRSTIDPHMSPAGLEHSFRNIQVRHLMRCVDPGIGPSRHDQSWLPDDLSVGNPAL